MYRPNTTWQSYQTDRQWAADLSLTHHRRHPAYAATLPRHVYELAFWKLKEVYESSHNSLKDTALLTIMRLNASNDTR